MSDECKETVRKISDGFKACSSAFTALGDRTRQLILLVLLESDLSGVRVGEIAKKAHITRPSVSHHLKILKDSGMVAMREEGTKNYYYLSVDDRWKDMLDLVELVYESIRNNGNLN